MNHLDEIRNFVVMTFLFGDPIPLEDDASLMDSGIIDSTGILELVTFMESSYHVTIENEEMIPENLDSVSRLARFLARKLDSAAAVAQTPAQRSTQLS
jgi:acyl carrier protein